MKYTNNYSVGEYEYRDVVIVGKLRMDGKTKARRYEKDIHGALFTQTPTPYQIDSDRFVAIKSKHRSELFIFLCFV